MAGQDKWWERVQPDFVTNEKPIEYWARQLDPGRIKSKNWSRRHKRNKKLWKGSGGQARSGGRVRNNASADSIREAFGMER